jgi:O-antigen ligase/polysaccharide polymerase Wzy-like membrane protein
VVAPVLVGVLLAIVCLWRSGRDPLLYLISPALAFPPLLAYGGRSLGWPTGWLSTKVALALCLTLWVVFRLARGDFRWNRLNGSWFIAPWVMLVLWSVIWVVLGPFNQDVGIITREFLRWALPPVAAACLAASIRSEADINLATLVLVWTALVVVIYTGFQGLVFAGQESFVPDPIIAVTRAAQAETPFAAYRLYGTLPNVGPNALGLFLIIPSTLAFSRAAGTTRGRRLVWLGAGLVMAFTIAATFSRGAQLGFAVALLALPVWRRSRFGLFAVVLGLVVTSFGVANTPVGESILRVHAAGQWDPDVEARIVGWRTIVQQFPDHPLGLGFDGWIRVSQHMVGFSDPFFADIGAGHAADNQWMLELAERGVLGVLALALMIGGLLVTSFRQAPRLHGIRRDVVTGCGAGFAGWAIAFVSGNHLMYDSIEGVFWYAVAVAVMASTLLPTTQQDLDTKTA